MSEPLAASATISIRPAVAGDLDFVRGCVIAGFEPYVARMGRPPMPMLADYAALIGEGHVYVAEFGGTPAGVLVILLEPEAVLVETLAVDGGLRSLGIGQRLLAFAEDTARAEGKSRVRLYTNVLMEDNLVWYPRRGYVETGRSTYDGRHRVDFAKEVGG
ncbi:MAG: GNAT family N-acetyltransferase [Rhodospirillaceae bacterium]|nr:GNAT family N-acetyltransferase [Rhodospirillaceae bacterium]